MAPQQNSTLIDENLEGCPPSLLSIPEEINRYSPILPPKNKANLDKNNNNANNHDNNKRNNCNQCGDNNFIPKWDLKEKEQRHHYKNKHYRSSSYRSGHSCRSRSISLYGVNSTVKEGHKEITIFLNDEARYVSGVTNKTTCRDIIKALIDDEINNGNYEYCQKLKDGTASRDYSDYVITECWRGIERSYDGNMAILPVWKAWSRVHNEIRLSLKHLKDIQEPLKTNTTLSSIRHYICKLLSFGKHKKQKLKAKNSENQKKTAVNDVILLHDAEKKSTGFDVKETCAIYKRKSIEMQAKTETNKERLYKLSETRSSVRKRRSSSRRKNKKSAHVGRRDFSTHNEPKNLLRKRKDSCIRSSVRNKLALKNVEMNELFDREYALTKELTNKCKMYKLQNELYTAGDQNLEMSVDQIQQSIEACAKEIIQTEYELLKVKSEIKQDISIINNLKRLTLDTDDVNECVVPIDLENVSKTQPVTKPTPNATNHKTTNCEQMFFVDNIYEFCDNNASMLV